MAASPPALQDPQLYRPQTWLLLLALVCIPLPLVLLVWRLVLPTTQSVVEVYAHRLLAADMTARLGMDYLAVLLTSLLLLGGLMALGAVISFRNRARQISLLRFGLIFLGLALAGKAWQIYDWHTDRSGIASADPNLTGAPGLGLGAMVLAWLLLALALRLVHRDQRRIQGMNRFWA